MIVWNAKRFEALKQAYELADRTGQGRFTVTFDRDQRPVEFTVEEAQEAIDDLDMLFRQPTKVYPPNNEGPEP